MSRAALEVVLFLAGAAVGLFVNLRPPPPLLVADQPPAVLRRVELRVVGDLDRTHPLVGGERYQAWECRRVPR